MLFCLVEVDAEKSGGLVSLRHHSRLTRLIILNMDLDDRNG